MLQLKFLDFYDRGYYFFSQDKNSNKMHSNFKFNLEKIFQNSRSNDELFDAFQLVIFKKMDDPELFKILLANPVLSKDEMIMYTEKYANDFPELAYEVYIWIAKLMDGQSQKPDCQETAFNYLKKANRLKPEENESLLMAIDLYNFDLRLSLNDHILEFTLKAVKSVKIKSVVYYRLVKFYKKTMQSEKARNCERLAEKSASEENQKL